MPTIKNIQTSFAGGEIAPEMRGRIDDAVYRAGLATCRNFMVKPQGVAENRAGFEFVREAGDAAHPVRLIPFVYSSTQTMVIEMGHRYLRFHTQGQTLMMGSTPYQISTLWGGEDIFDIHYVQSGDVMTFVHPKYPPVELRRYGATDWRLEYISFEPPINAPTGVTATASGYTTAKYDYWYVVTALKDETRAESVASEVATCSGNIYETGAINTITWNSVAGATLYRVYKMEGGVYGYIGQTEGLSLIDENIAPDMSMTPPRYDNNGGLNTGAGTYPSAVTYYEQRRCFAGTSNAPNQVWMTKSGTESVMAYSLPLRDDDRISIKVAARENNIIRHLVPLTRLVMLTSAAEWQVTPQNSDAITPTTISVRPQSYIGASNVQPVVVNNSLVFAAERGGHARELGYSWQANGFVTGDLSLRAPHLFDNLTIKDMAYAKAPYPVVWCVSSSGKLLGLTYVPEQRIGGWHQHTTKNGAFESCCVVAEGMEDRLYVVVKRRINGVETRYIERLASRQFISTSQNVFLDSSLSYHGNAVTQLSGLNHLEGETVSVLADGAVLHDKVVKDGAITLEYPAENVIVGYPIDAAIQTLPYALGIQDGSYAQGRMRNVNKLCLRVASTATFHAGQYENKTTELKVRTDEPYGAGLDVHTGDIPITLSPSWSLTGQVWIKMPDPLPLSLMSVVVEYSIGGS